LDVTYERISGSPGSLLLLWAEIERSARQEVIRAHGHLPKSAHGIAALLRIWADTVAERQADASLSALLVATLRTKLQDSLKVRNGICHGLIGISSARGDAPATLTWEIAGQEHCVTWDELQSSFRWLSKVPLAISLISNSLPESRGSRMIDSSENREWWLSEFALNLPPV
jgi:hypothetical protein